MILLIDNYDSFTWNLWHFLSDLGGEVVTLRNDEKNISELLAMAPEAIVISPGPCTPSEAGVSVDLIKAAADVPIPIMGVCLGFQSIGVAFGGTVKRAEIPVHGKISMVKHQGATLLRGCDNPVAVTRYQSLILDPETLPDCFDITAETDAGIIMGISHTRLPVHGLLFHPESIASVNGYRMFANFLDLAGIIPLDEERLLELEQQTLNLAERYPEHIHA